MADDNAFVRYIATVLHSRSHFGHLTFDLSEICEHFAKTVDCLKSRPMDKSVYSKIPLLAELLDSKITNKLLGITSPSLTSRDLKSNCLNSFCGFKIRGQTAAQRMKESYLDRLQEECERRRVHVPIPGRSFGKQDVDEESFLDGFNHQNHERQKSSKVESPGSRRAPSFPRPTFVARKADVHDGETLNSPNSTSTGTSGSVSNPNKSARAKLLAMHGQSPAAISSGGGGSSATSERDGSDKSNVNSNASRRMALLSSASASESADRNTLRHLNTSGTVATAGNKRSGGIKLLDFSDLPAIGLQAKKLRKGKSFSTYWVAELSVIHEYSWNFTKIVTFPSVFRSGFY